MATRLKRNNAKSVYRTITDYGIITIGMLLGAVGMTFFLLPNQITTGGLMGIASIIYWGTNIPVQNTYFVLNALLIAVALKVLGWRFCAKTIYAVTVFTVSLTVLQHIVDPKLHLLADQKFMACIVGGVFLGTSVGLGLSAGGSTGGSDVVASMLFCDLAIITSSYVVLKDWEKVLYGYVLLFIVSFCVDYMVNSLHRSVQFFIISDRYEAIGQAINQIAERGCSTLYGSGFYSKKDIKVIYCIAKKSESSLIFDIIDEIDPEAFVAQSSVIGVYGHGFDHVVGRKKIGLDKLKEKIKE